MGTKNLTIFGGKPAFQDKLFVGSPLVGTATRRRYLALMKGVFERNYLTNDGPLVRELEAELARLHQTKYCSLVCNATIAQILMLKAMGLQGEIILPSFTFIATAHACIWQGLTPVFCDIDPDTLMIDPVKAESLITDRTCAILGVHLFGNVCNIPALERVCRKHNLKLIFDAAHAFNCSLGDRPVGGFGEAEFMSFHATKFFGTFEGGAIFTNDSDLDSRIRSKRNFGFSGYDDVRSLGINGKMCESSAAMGLASLPDIPAREKTLRRGYELYKSRLSKIPGVSVLNVGEQGRSNYHYVVVILDPLVFGVSRDNLVDILWKENVIARKYFYPGCHLMDYYQKNNKGGCISLPITEDLSTRILCLPSKLQKPERDIAKMANLLQTVHDNAGRIQKWVKTHEE